MTNQSDITFIFQKRKRECLCEWLSYTQTYKRHSRLQYLTKIIYKPHHSILHHSKLYHNIQRRNTLYRNKSQCNRFDCKKHFRLVRMWIVLWQALSRQQVEPKAKMYAWAYLLKKVKKMNKHRAHGCFCGILNHKWMQHISLRTIDRQQLCGLLSIRQHKLVLGKGYLSQRGIWNYTNT